MVERSFFFVAEKVRYVEKVAYIDSLDLCKFYGVCCAGRNEGMVLGTFCFYDDEIHSRCANHPTKQLDASLENARRRWFDEKSDELRYVRDLQGLE